MSIMQWKEMNGARSPGWLEWMLSDPVIFLLFFEASLPKSSNILSIVQALILSSVPQPIKLILIVKLIGTLLLC